MPWAQGAFFKMVGPPTFEKNLKTEPNFSMLLSEIQTNFKIDHIFAHVWCSWSKLCNVFDDACPFYVSMFIHIWAASWQNRQSDCAPSIRLVWSESSLCAQWVAKDPKFLHADSEDSDQTGRMPRCNKFVSCISPILYNSAITCENLVNSVHSVS